VARSGARAIVAARVIRTIAANDPRWAEYVRSHEGATAYHLPEWAEILHTAYRWQPASLGLERDGRLAGVLPLVAKRGRLTGGRLRSLPVGPTAGPLGDTPEDEAALLTAAAQLADQRDLTLVVETRRLDLDKLATGIRATKTMPTWILDVPDDLDAWQRERPRRLIRGIKRAQKHGVTVRPGTGDADLERFYELYLATMRRHRSPPRSLLQLREARRLLGDEGIFRLFVAEHEGRIVAGGVWHAFNGIVELLYNASDHEALDHRPNHALYRDVVGWAKENGFARVDFGLAWPEDPLAEFKRQWGAVEVREVAYVQGEPTAQDDDGQEVVNTIGERIETLRKGVDKAWERAPLPLTAAVSTFALRYL
jgi:hypothetical protein